MSQNYTWPSVSVTATNPSVALNNASPSAASSTLVAGQNPSGDQQALQTNVGGDLKTTVTGSALPTGAATAAKQDTGNASLASIDGKTVHVDTGAVVVASSALPSGAATEASLAFVVTSTGQTAGNTAALVLSQASSSAGANGPLVMGISTVAAPTYGSAQVNALSLNTSGQLRVIEAGSATSALQTTGNASLSSIDTKLTSPLAVTGTFFQATQPVSGTFWQATQPVSAAALPLPSGASTSANQATALTRLSGSLVPTAYDEIVLSYTGSNITTAVYKLATVTVKTLTLSYTGAQLDSVVAS